MYVNGVAILCKSVWPGEVNNTPNVQDASVVEADNRRRRSRPRKASALPSSDPVSVIDRGLRVGGGQGSSVASCLQPASKQAMRRPA